MEQVRAIRAATNVSLECFIHGALCVSYSGQCYISEVVVGRSANRGNCAQFCRHAYDLHDLQGRMLARGRYLLSMKDLNLSHCLTALIDAGVDSFKIEGRLKNEEYVKNVTAYYRQLLDHLMAARDDLIPSSSGSCSFGFVPDPERVFNRGQCSYFFAGKRNRTAQINTPKSLGKKLGRVVDIQSGFFTLNTSETVANGDGLCFFDNRNQLIGLRVNMVEGKRLFPRSGVADLGLKKGMEVFRNQDVEFSRQLQNSRLCRSIALDLTLYDHGDTLELQCRDEDGITSSTQVAIKRETARKPGALQAVAGRQLRKCGDTIFSIGQIKVYLADDLFVPAAVLNELRRSALDVHAESRLEGYRRESRQLRPNSYPWIADTVTSLDNITNSSAAAFYKRHGVKPFSQQKLRADLPANTPLMTTRYCVRFQLGMCSHSTSQEQAIAEPLILSDKTGKYLLQFHCRQCEMTVRKYDEP